MGDPEFGPGAGLCRCFMSWRFTVSEKKHILEGAPEMIVGEFAPLFGSIGRNKNAMAQDARDRICRVVLAAEDQMDSIHAQIMKCAAELPNFKPMVSGTGLEVQVANLVAFLRSELEAEKLNTAQMVAISNERDAHVITMQRILQSCESGAAMSEAADVVESLANDRRDLQTRLKSNDDAYRDAKRHIYGALIGRSVVGSVDLGPLIDAANALREEATALRGRVSALESERDEVRELQRRKAITRPELHALTTLAEFAGVREPGELSPLELIGKITDSLKAVMTAHDEDMRRIWELKRVHKDRAEWGRTIGHALDALPDPVKASLGDMTCVPECIQRLGRLAEDTLLYQAQVEGLNRAVAGLQAEVGPLLQRLNDAQRRADYGRRLYEAERYHCARIVAVLNDAQILTDLNELPF